MKHTGKVNMHNDLCALSGGVYLLPSLLCRGRTSRSVASERSFIHLTLREKKSTLYPPTPLQAFHLYSHRRRLFCQSRWRERRVGGRKGAGGRMSGKGWEGKRQQVIWVSCCMPNNPTSCLPPAWFLHLRSSKHRGGVTGCCELSALPHCFSESHPPSL